MGETVVGLGALAERRILLPDDTYSGDQTVELVNPGWIRISLWLNVTVNPGAAETIRLRHQTRIPTVGGTLLTIVSTPASSLGGAPGTVGLHAGPGIINGWATDVGANNENNVPAYLVFLVDVSAAGAWEYELGLDGFGP